MLGSIESKCALLVLNWRLLLISQNKLAELSGILAEFARNLVECWQTICRYVGPMGRSLVWILTDSSAAHSSPDKKLDFQNTFDASKLNSIEKFKKRTFGKFWKFITANGATIDQFRLFVIVIVWDSTSKKRLSLRTNFCVCTNCCGRFCVNLHCVEAKLQCVVNWFQLAW